MKKIVLLTNIMSPYRSVFYRCMYERGKCKGIEFYVLLMNDTESNRQWKYEDFQESYTKLLTKKVFFGKSDSLYLNTDLEECLSQINPDVLITAGSYTFFPVWQATKWVRSKPGCKLLFWSESHLEERREYNHLILFIRHFIRKRFYSQMEGFWYPGEKARELIEKYASMNAIYIQVPNLINNQKFAKLANEYADKRDELREKYQLSLTKKFFFSPMRLTKVKGLLPFLEIVRSVAGRELMQIAVAGEGELESDIRAFADNNNIDLKLLGYRNEIEIIELLSCADWFFMPSLSDPNPLSCIEALWCGKPLLLSRHVGNAPEVVEHGKNGFVFSYENRTEAVAMIREILKKPSEWYQDARAISKRIAEEQFDLVKNTDRILDQVNKL